MSSRETHKAYSRVVSCEGKQLTNKIHYFTQTKESLPQRVVLKKVGFRSSGLYRCEVTISSPTKVNGYLDAGRRKIGMVESIRKLTVVGEI